MAGMTMIPVSGVVEASVDRCVYAPPNFHAFVFYCLCWTDSGETFFKACLLIINLHDNNSQPACKVVR